MKKLKFTLLGLLILLATCLKSQAVILKFGGPVDSVQAETDSTAMGSGILLLDTDTNTIDLTIHINGLANELTMSHIHSGAAEATGPVIVDIGDMSVYDVVGDFYSLQLQDIPFPPEELVNLLAGNTYLNFHTDTFGDGEVRGQLNYVPVTTDSLINLSTRGMVNPGDGKASLLIGGLIVKEPKSILFRMVADSLTRFGVQTSLKDTSFEIHKTNPGDPLEVAELIGGNDNWKEGGQEFLITMTGIAPEFENESAVILHLDAGSYTMSADSEQGAGIALIEMFGMDPKSLGALIGLAANGSVVQEFSILDSILNATGLKAVLDGPGPFTLFAPTDAAFLTAFTQEQLDELLADDGDMTDDLDALSAILLGHVAGGSILSSSLIEGAASTVTTLIGDDVEILLSGGVITVDNATVLEGDIASSNGVIHVIDMILE